MFVKRLQYKKFKDTNVFCSEQEETKYWWTSPFQIGYLPFFLFFFLSLLSSQVILPPSCFLTKIWVNNVASSADQCRRDPLQDYKHLTHLNCSYPEQFLSLLPDFFPPNRKNIFLPGIEVLKTSSHLQKLKGRDAHPGDRGQARGARSESPDPDPLLSTGGKSQPWKLGPCGERGAQTLPPEPRHSRSEWSRR